MSQDDSIRKARIEHAQAQQATNRIIEGETRRALDRAPAGDPQATSSVEQAVRNSELAVSHTTTELNRLEAEGNNAAAKRADFSSLSAEISGADTPAPARPSPKKP